MVEYKKRLINLKGGGTRHYYTKTYKNGKEVRVKKEEYNAKGGFQEEDLIFEKIINEKYNGDLNKFLNDFKSNKLEYDDKQKAYLLYHAQNLCQKNKKYFNFEIPLCQPPPPPINSKFLKSLAPNNRKNNGNITYTNNPLNNL
jgi:hypothetical protein